MVAIKNNLVTGAAIASADINPYIDGGFGSLRCPSGGVYTLNPIDTDPECSVHGRAYRSNVNE